MWRIITSLEIRESKGRVVIFHIMNEIQLTVGCFSA